MTALTKRVSHALVFGAMWVLSALAWAAGEIELEGGQVLRVSEIEYNRMLPHAFYDQALSSLPHLFRRHVLLASRRSGDLGELSYALVCFRKSPSSKQVVIQGVAVFRAQAWHFETVAPFSVYADTMAQVLEQLVKLPTRPALQ